MNLENSVITPRLQGRSHDSVTYEVEHSSQDHKQLIHEDLNESPYVIEWLCFRIDHLSKSKQFYLLTSGIFGFYLLYGYFQELIFKLDGFKSFGWYLTLVQFALYTVFGKVELFLRNDTTRRVSVRGYLLLAVLTLGTMALSNSSVGYLNYPTEVMFKCCKLIPVLIGGILIQGKRHGVYDFVAAGCMSIGLIFFTLADVEVSPNFDIRGVVMISLALVDDACLGNVQEKIMKQCQPSNTEVVYYSYGFGFVILLIGSVFSGHLNSAFEFCSQHPWETYGYAVIFSATGYFGIQLVLALIKTSGAFVAVTVTTCRKAVTIIFSFIFFSKPFTIQYIWSALLVILGIYINLYGKQKHKVSVLSWWLSFRRLFSKRLSEHEISLAKTIAV